MGENSPEEVAYKLLVTIAMNEKKSLRGVDAARTAECLSTVRNPGSRLREREGHGPKRSPLRPRQLLHQRQPIPHSSFIHAFSETLTKF
jgi:hypothetical protein